MEFKRISVRDAVALIESRDGQVQVVDIRDEDSFRRGHIEGAFHLHNSNIQDYIQEADPELPLLVCCYHGHMSQSAAAYLSEQGFSETYSLDGGFEAWAQSAAGESESV